MRLPLSKRRREDAVDVADRRLLVVTGPCARDGVTEIKTLNSIHEVAHEIGSAQFAIGKNIKADLHLPVENAHDLAILDGLQFLSRCIHAPCFQQFRQTQKAAHMASAVVRPHFASPFPGPRPLAHTYPIRSTDCAVSARLPAMPEGGVPSGWRDLPARCEYRH